MEKEKALEELLEKSKKQGYVLFDEVDETADKYDLSIIDFDWLTKKLSLLHTQILDEPPKPQEVTTRMTVSSSEDDYYDLAHEDYNIYYDKIIKIDPELKELVEKVKSIIPPQRLELRQLMLDLQVGKHSMPYDNAIKRLSEMYLRVALKMGLHRYEMVGGNLSELIDIATIGLMNSLYNYDPLDRRPINTYICFYIYREFIRSGDCPKPLIYYPAHIKDAYTSRLPKLLKEFGRNLEYFTSDDTEELKEWIKENIPKDVSDNEYEQIVMLCLSPDISLDAMLEQSNGDDNVLNKIVLIDDIINEKDPAYYAMVSDTRNVVAYICSKLKDKEREIVYLRHGFIDGREYTLQECGERFNLSRERIRQIENKAYRKLRLYLMKMKIEPFMLNT